MSVVDERRSSPRTDGRWPVTMMTSRGVMEGEIQNMNNEGAFIRCQNPLGPNELLLLKVDMPGGAPREIAAQVVWSNKFVSDEKSGPIGMGVQFKSF